GTEDIMIANSGGKVVRFNEKEVRVMSRQTVGVKGITNGDSETIGVCSEHNGAYLLSITANGFAKKTLFADYRLTGRGTKGVKAMNLTPRTGALKFIQSINGDEDIIVATKNGNVIRLNLEQIPLLGRATSGVKIVRLDDDDE